MAQTLTKVPGNGASEPDRFGRALLLAMVIEALGISAFMFAPRPPAAVPPAVVQLQVLQPAPQPVAKPPPPTPPKPAPVVPQPVTPPVPLPPPVPHHASPHHVMRHVVHTPPPPPQPAPPIPQPVAPVTAAPPISPQAQQSALSRYIGQVRAIVLSNLVVPQLLVDSGMDGDCVLQFTLAPDGSLLSVSVLTPSGIKSVNDAALDALRASHLPAFLTGMPDTPHVFTLPVHVSGDQQ
jgi:protein TonB